MIGIVGQGKMGGSYQELGTPAAPADAHSASNGILGDKAPLGFVPYFSISFQMINDEEHYHRDVQDTRNIQHFVRPKNHPRGVKNS